ncbi:LexA family transcriptional regulator [Methylobacterium aquaticum]|uniref:LexA family transcriptional regulator n=1 Tax=Methylobacterium aquaticum TaxID=270351 RepID=UPI003D1785D1
MNSLQSSHSGESTFASRLGELISEHRSANAFAKHVGITESLIRKYLSGGTPGLDKAVQIARAKNVHVEWLATGEGPRDIQPEYAISSGGTKEEHMGPALRQGAILDETSEDAIALPRLTIEGSAGHGLIPTREEIEDYLSVSRRYLREVGINPSYAHVLRLSGHSMAPTLLDKDLVIVDTSQNRVRDEEIYALAYGDAVLIKRIRPQLDGGLKVISDNKGGHYEDAIVPAAERHQVRIVGRVGGFLRYI